MPDFSLMRALAESPGYGSGRSNQLDDSLTRALASAVEDADALRRRVGELLAANNATEAERREAVWQRDIARDTIHVLQEALHARNEMNAKLEAELVAARRPAPLFPHLGPKERLAIAAACSDFLRRGMARWQDERYPATDAGLVRALEDEVDAMIADATSVQAPALEETREA
jgi:hypothetical protein